MGLVKLGQPHPDSNLSDEANSGSPHTISTYIPGLSLSRYAPVPGASVPLFCVTRYCSGGGFRGASSLLLNSRIGLSGVIDSPPCPVKGQLSLNLARQKSCACVAHSLAMTSRARPCRHSTMVSIDTIVSTETIVLWPAPFRWSFIHCEARF